MRKTRLIIQPTRCLHAIGFLLIYLSCPIYGDWGLVQQPEVALNQREDHRVFGRELFTDKRVLERIAATPSSLKETSRYEGLSLARRNFPNLQERRVATQTRRDSNRRVLSAERAAREIDRRFETMEHQRRLSREGRIDREVRDMRFARNNREEPRIIDRRIREARNVERSNVRLQNRERAALKREAFDQVRAKERSFRVNDDRSMETRTSFEVFPTAKTFNWNPWNVVVDCLVGATTLYFLMRPKTKMA